MNEIVFNLLLKYNQLLKIRYKFALIRTYQIFSLKSSLFINKEGYIQLNKI